MASASARLEANVKLKRIGPGGLGPVALVTQLGITVASALVLSLLLGLWLDSQFGTRPLMTLVFSMIGVLIGTVGMYRLVSRAIAESAATLPRPVSKEPKAAETGGASDGGDGDPGLDVKDDQVKDDWPDDKDDWDREAWRDDDVLTAEQRRRLRDQADQPLAFRPPSAKPTESEEKKQ